MASKPFGNIGGWSAFWYTTKPMVSMLVSVFFIESEGLIFMVSVVKLAWIGAGIGKESSNRLSGLGKSGSGFRVVSGSIGGTLLSSKFDLVVVLFGLVVGIDSCVAVVFAAICGV